MREALCIEAARNNAAWCDAVCSAHGAPGELTASLWMNRGAVPRSYPKLITLDRATGPALAAIRELEASGVAGTWGVKDSFRGLALEDAGFEVLFDAEWILRPAARPPGPPPVGVHWVRVETADALAEWEAAWGESAGQPRVFLPPLLERAEVAVLACHRNGALVAGVMANRSETMVGLSNLFVRAGEADAVREGTFAAASLCFPGLPLAGYETVESLASFRRAGFVSLGPLRVWTKRR